MSALQLTKIFFVKSTTLCGNFELEAFLGAQNNEDIDNVHGSQTTRTHSVQRWAKCVWIFFRYFFLTKLSIPADNVFV